ncbi:hypothetical protein AMTR_s00136p00054180 [Amborella trichopoda]|uniref:Uncharacterized protein n=1 Tax=Amborella trichopoda TaxID=13333 RepID=W1NEV3_AMBTC|nr:hypothetical protein AMTR_s00136p00054180 [Amborella trichopoda]
MKGFCDARSGMMGASEDLEIPLTPDEPKKVSHDQISLKEDGGCRIHRIRKGREELRNGLRGKPHPVNILEDIQLTSLRSKFKDGTRQNNEETSARACHKHQCTNNG